MLAMYDLNDERTWIMVMNIWRFGMVIGKPTFIPVKDLEMGFEKMVKIAHSSGGRILNFYLALMYRSNL